MNDLNEHVQEPIIDSGMDEITKISKEINDTLGSISEELIKSRYSIIKDLYESMESSSKTHPEDQGIIVNQLVQMNNALNLNNLKAMPPSVETVSRMVLKQNKREAMKLIKDQERITSFRFNFKENLSVLIERIVHELQIKPEYNKLRVDLIQNTIFRYIIDCNLSLNSIFISQLFSNLSGYKGSMDYFKTFRKSLFDLIAIQMGELEPVKYKPIMIPKPTDANILRFKSNNTTNY